jgi:hypothetical protein
MEALSLEQLQLLQASRVHFSGDKCEWKQFEIKFCARWRMIGVPLRTVSECVSEGVSESVSEGVGESVSESVSECVSEGNKFSVSVERSLYDDLLLSCNDYALAIVVDHNHSLTHSLSENGNGSNAWMRLSTIMNNKTLNNKRIGDLELKWFYRGGVVPASFVLPHGYITTALVEEQLRMQYSVVHGNGIENGIERGGLVMQCGKAIPGVNSDGLDIGLSPLTEIMEGPGAGARVGGVHSVSAGWCGVKGENSKVYGHFHVHPDSTGPSLPSISDVIAFISESHNRNIEFILTTHRWFMFISWQVHDNIASGVPFVHKQKICEQLRLFKSQPINTKVIALLAQYGIGVYSKWTSARNTAGCGTYTLTTGEEDFCREGDSVFH